MIANLQSLVFAQKHGIYAVLRSEDTEIHTLQASSLQISRRAGWSLSVFAADGPCRGVCITGAKYSLQDAELIPSFPLGVSNQWASETAEISVREGILLIVLSRLPVTEQENS
jgi:thiamine pyrophosphokinase